MLELKSISYSVQEGTEQLGILNRSPSEIRAANRLLTGTLGGLLEGTHV